MVQESSSGLGNKVLMVLRPLVLIRTFFQSRKHSIVTELNFLLNTTTILTTPRTLEYLVAISSIMTRNTLRARTVNGISLANELTYLPQSTSHILLTRKPILPALSLWA